VAKSWFATQPRCEKCGLDFRVEGGFYLGSIYFNYGLTASITLVAYFALYFSEILTSQQILIVLSCFCLIFPLWFFRYARSFWIAFDECFDPWPNEDEARQL